MFQLCGAWGSGSPPQLLRQSRLCPFTHRLWDSLSIEAELQRVESGVTYKRVAQVVTEMGL